MQGMWIAPVVALVTITLLSLRMVLILLFKQAYRHSSAIT